MPDAEEILSPRATPAGRARRELLEIAAEMQGRRGPRRELAERVREIAERIREERAMVMEGSIEYAALELTGARIAEAAVGEVSPRITRALQALDRHRVAAAETAHPIAHVLLDFASELLERVGESAVARGALQEHVVAALRSMDDRHQLGICAELGGRWEALLDILCAEGADRPPHGGAGDGKR